SRSSRCAPPGERGVSTPRFRARPPVTHRGVHTPRSPTPYPLYRSVREERHLSGAVGGPPPPKGNLHVLGELGSGVCEGGWPTLRLYIDCSSSNGANQVGRTAWQAVEGRESRLQ